MRHDLKVVILLFISLTGVFVEAKSRQEKTIDGVTVVDPAASREDLRRSTAKVERAIRDAERRSRDAARKAREAMEAELKESSRLRLLAEEKLRIEVQLERVKQEKAQEERDRERNKLIYGMVGVSMVIIVALLSIAFFQRGTKTVEQEEGYQVPPTHKADEILSDPDIPALREYASRKNDNLPVPFYLTLHVEGLKPLCLARVVEGKDPLIISVGGKEVPSPGIGWSKRKEKVARFVSGNNIKPVS